jgi:type III restriction enzyme
VAQLGLVRRLVDRDEIDYDANSELLFKLSGQMVARFKGYLKDNEVEAVLRAHDRMLSDYIFEQMISHCEETPTTYVPQVERGYTRLNEQQFGHERDLQLRDFREGLASRSDIGKYLFNGFAKCALDAQRFQSDDERRFAVLIDQHTPEVKVWLKPGPGVFQITYERGKKYEPDFLVETANEMLICEVKADDQKVALDVLAKAAAARVWIGAANEVAKDNGRKHWRYGLIPTGAVTEAATLAGLMGTYGMAPAAPRLL